MFKRAIENELRILEGFDPLRLEDFRLVQLFLVFPGILGSASDHCSEVIDAMDVPRPVGGGLAAFQPNYRLEFLTNIQKLEGTCSQRLIELQRMLGAVRPEDVN
jgi:hypothetical protein